MPRALMPNVHRDAWLESSQSPLSRSQERVEWLTREHDSVCASVQLGLGPQRTATSADRLKLKNRLGEVEQRLQSFGALSSCISDMLNGTETLLQDPMLWRPQSGSLGIYATGDSCEIVWFRRVLETRVMVGPSRFYVLPMLEDGGLDYLRILCLSQNAARLLEVECHGPDLHHGVERLMDMPDGFEGLRRSIDAEKQTHCHTSSGARHPEGGHRHAMFHGHGTQGDKAAVNKWLLDYCREVDRTMADRFSDDRTPVLLFATEPLHAMFAQASHSRVLRAEAPLGNPDHLADHEVARIALAAHGERERESQRLSHRIESAVSAGRWSCRLDQILAYALDGRIESLLVRPGGVCWGQYDPSSRHFLETRADDSASEELINRAALETWRRSGRVDRVSEPPVDAFGDGPVSAILRY